MATDEIELLTKLRNQMVTFLDELIDSFPTEADFIMFRIFVKDQIPMVDIMKYIAFNLCPLKNMIKERDEKFFLEHNVLFEQLDEKKSKRVNHFKSLWKIIDSEDKETIWRWFSSFVFLADKWLDLKKQENKLQ